MPRWNTSGKRGSTVPDPFPTTALIDTGASHTAVAPFIVERLGIVASTGFTEVLVPGESSDGNESDSKASTAWAFPFILIRGTPTTSGPSL